MPNKQKVIKHIKTAILNRQLNPGEHLKEEYLAACLNISRAPVREALKELCFLGWLTEKHNKGVFVTEVNGKHLTNSFNICAIIEGYIVAASCQLYTSNDFKQIEQTLKQMQKLSETKNIETLNDLEYEFHDLIIRLRGEPQLIKVARQWSEQVHFLAMPFWNELYDLTDCYNRHIIIYEAILNKKHYPIEITIRNHYKESATRICTVINN